MMEVGYRGGEWGVLGVYGWVEEGVLSWEGIFVVGFVGCMIDECVT